jgi:hypothetical protein
VTELVSELKIAARELLDSVSFDENGELIGGKWMGGHGGLISQKTHQKADTLRRVLSRFEEGQKP